LRNAEAESEALNRIAQAIPGGDPGQYLITVRYIESLRDMTRTNNSKVIFMPVETSAMLSSIGAIKEVLSQTGEKDKKDEKEQPAPPPPPRPRELGRGFHGFKSDLRRSVVFIRVICGERLRCTLIL
jgi:hypothetical protein